MSSKNSELTERISIHFIQMYKDKLSLENEIYNNMY